MADPVEPQHGMLGELQRRKVLRTAAVYAVAGLAAIEFVDSVFPYFGFSAVAARWVILAVITGFPVALLLAWFFRLEGGRPRLRPGDGWVRTLSVLGVTALGTAAIGALAALLAPVGPAEQAPPGITVLAPPEWAGEVPSVRGQDQEMSIRVRGTARSDQGVAAVWVDGLLAATRRQGPGEVVFSGFVAPPAAGLTREVPLRMEDSAGVTFEETFRVIGTQDAEAVEPSTRDTGRTTYVVLIGVSETGEEGLFDEPSVAADIDTVAEALYGAWRRIGEGGPPPESPPFFMFGSRLASAVGAEATLARIRELLGPGLAAATDVDRLFLYLAAPIVPDPGGSGEPYLLAYDSRADDLAGTALPIRELAELVMGPGFGHVIILLESPGNLPGLGPMPLSRVADRLHERHRDGGLLFLSAAQQAQLPMLGAFTGGVVSAIRGEGDRDADGRVTLGEFVDQVRYHVRRSTRNAQIPWLAPLTYDRVQVLGYTRK